MVQHTSHYGSVISGKNFSIVLSELFALLSCRYRVVPSIKVRGPYLQIYMHSRLVSEIPLFEELLTSDVLVVTMLFVQIQDWNILNFSTAYICVFCMIPTINRLYYIHISPTILSNGSILCSHWCKNWIVIHNVHYVSPKGFNLFSCHRLKVQISYNF